MSNPPSKDPLSPCIGVCTLEPQTRLCIGCFRSIDEIAAWSRYSMEEKRQVLAKLEGRRARLPSSTSCT